MSFEQVCVVCGDPDCYGPSGRHQPAAAAVTAAVPDSRDEWGCRCWPYKTPPPVGHTHFANGCDRHPERRPGAASVPDPRGVEQIARVLAGAGPRGKGVTDSEYRHMAQAIAAEVEARVQAAANQRAAEDNVKRVARAVLATPGDWPGSEREQEWAEHIARAALDAAR